MPKPDNSETLTIDGHAVRISNPAKPYFTQQAQLTKLDIVRYFLSVAPGALLGVRDRPIVLKRFVDGAEKDPFYQKRAPSDSPDWIRKVTLAFPSGRTADELVVDNAAGLAWIVNLGCMELHPHPVRSADLDHPDELRIDLDPVPGIGWDDVRRVALEVRALLEEHKLTSFAKTSGSRGMHVNVRIGPRWTFTEVRRAALALSRAMERRMPGVATSKWWKEERQGVFLDYNQNAKDRTTASAYSVRPLPDARVSAPLHWQEVIECNPEDFTVLTMPARFAAIGDPHADMDNHAGSLESLLELAALDEAEGLGDAPWPPHFAKGENEGPRVQPSKARRSPAPAPKSFDQQLGEGFGNKRFRKRSAQAASGKDAADGGALDSSTEDAEALPARASERPEPKAPRKSRASARPLLTIANSPSEADARAGLERWKSQHPEAASHLAPSDILVDRMRGRSYVWFRIRVNLQHVPENLRPPQGAPDPDDDPTRG